MSNLSSGYPEAYAAGSARLRRDARESVMAQGYKLGQNYHASTTSHLMHNPSSNIKMRGPTIPLQNFAVILPWKTPSGLRSTSQQRVSQPSLNLVSPVIPIGTRMPWNQ